VPSPIADVLVAHDELAVAKATQARMRIGPYMVNAMLAGAYIGVAVVLLVLASGPFVAAKSPATKLVQGAVFGVALTLVVFAGAELFTGNLMVMAQGLLARTVNGAQAGMVWVWSLVGNLAGSVLFAGLVAASGVINAGAEPGKQTVFMTALTGIVHAKAALTGGQLFFRAVLCNFLVCLALWMAARTKSDAAKLIVLWWALLAFVASGFEHSVANMTLFSVGIFVHAPGATWGALFRNLLYTVPGNFVGGAVMVGLAYAYIGDSMPSLSLRRARPVSVPAVDLTEKAQRPLRVKTAARTGNGNGEG
jgi:nitrite transporter NirC